MVAVTIEICVERESAVYSTVFVLTGLDWKSIDVSVVL